MASASGDGAGSVNGGYWVGSDGPAGTHSHPGKGGGGGGSGGDSGDGGQQGNSGDTNV